MPTVRVKQTMKAKLASDALEALRRSSSHMTLRVMPSYYRRPGIAARLFKEALVMLPGSFALVLELAPAS